MGKRRVKKKSKLKNLLLIFPILAIFSAILIYKLAFPPKEFVKNVTIEKVSGIFYNYEITKYPSYGKIYSLEANKNITLGVVTDPFNLAFGEIPVGGHYVKRAINLKNNFNKTVKVEIKVYGNVSKIVEISERKFILNPFEEKQIPVYFLTNRTSPGFFNGEIDVIVKVPKYKFFEWLDI